MITFLSVWTLGVQENCIFIVLKLFYVPAQYCVSDKCSVMHAF